MTSWEHLWRKAGTDDSGDKILRVWTCKHCGATKRRLVNKKDSAPRATLDRTVSAKECR